MTVDGSPDIAVRSASSIKRPPSIGVLTRAGMLTGWQRAALARVEQETGAVVRALIRLDAADVPARGMDAGRAVQWAELIEGLALRTQGPDDSAFAGTALAGAGEVDAAGVAALELDLIVNPGLPVDAVRWASRARLGMIEIRFQGVADESAIARAVIGRSEVIGVAAVLFAPGAERPLLLYESTPALSDRRFIVRVKADVQRRAADLLVRSLGTALGEHGREMQVRARMVHDVASGANAVPDEEAAGRERLRPGRHLLRVAASVARNRLERPFFRHDHWFLAHRPLAADVSIVQALGSAAAWRIVDAPADRFYADPCVFAKDGVEHIFFEDYRYGSRKGVVSWMAHRGGTFSPPEVVLDLPSHLSYPFVFEHEARIFMVPETEQASRLALYEAVEFPIRWRNVGLLLDAVRAADATLHERDGRWWMFANIGRSGAPNWDTLHLFHADSPFGPWHPHPENPIKSDCRSARPAGRLFSVGGRTFRPAQNCAQTYGGALVLCEIEEMTTTRYREKVVMEVSPALLPGSSGLHTVSFAGSLAMVDGKRARRFRW